MIPLQSPGVDVEIIDESIYVPSGPGTVPLIILATQSNKSSPSGVGIAAFTNPIHAGKLYLATNQRDLIQNFGYPIFYSSSGTPQHGYELNEFGLWAAYSYLGMANQCYILRANIDLLGLKARPTAPSGPPKPSQYWLDLSSTRWGVFRAKGNPPGTDQWGTPIPITYVDASYVADNTKGSVGDIVIVISDQAIPTDNVSTNLLYEKVATTGWKLIGSTAWNAGHPTVVTGTATGAVVVVPGDIVINTVTVTLAGVTVDSVVTSITTAVSANAGISAIVASKATNGALVITNNDGTAITLSGSPLTSLGLVAKTYPGVSVFRNSGTAYPDQVAVGSVANSIWVKGNAANKGAHWVIKYYNSTVGQWIIIPTQFFPFDSTIVDDNDRAKDAAARLALVNPAFGSVYIGFDLTTGVQIPRRWDGSKWIDLVYIVDVTPPTTAPVAGTQWYNTSYDVNGVDIMYNDGVNWLGYANAPLNSGNGATDPNGPQVDGSPPTTQSTQWDSVNSQWHNPPLVNGDLWIDGTDLENYPAIHRWNVADNMWKPIDNTDQTTPFGIVFADARGDSGPDPTGSGVPTWATVSGQAYKFNSTDSLDMTKSNYLDPDAPDPTTYPAGTLLFNLRYSKYNVKEWTPNWFLSGGFNGTNYTATTYTVGHHTFPALNVGEGGTWRTVSPNNDDGSPNMGRKAQRSMIVKELAAVINANQDIRSEVVFFNLVAAPGYPELLSELKNLNDNMKNTAFILGDTPARLKPDGTSIQAWASNTKVSTMTTSGDLISGAGNNGDNGLLTHDKYIGLFYPWALGNNIDGSEVMVPPSAIALVTFAYSDQVSYPWYAPAGFNRGLISNATSVGYLSSEGEFIPTILNQGQRDVIYTSKINPFAYIPNRGLVIYGQKTLSPIASALDRINVSRLCCYIAYNLDNILKPFLFEQNVTSTREAAKAVCDRFFNRLVAHNGVYDFVTLCDRTNNTPDRIDANELWIDCAIQPVKAVEFIYVPVRILTTQATG